MSHRSVFYDLEMRDVWTGMADTIVLPIAGLGILVMDRAGFEAALSAGRALIPPEAPSLHTKPRSSDAGLLDAEQLEAVTAIPAGGWQRREHGGSRSAKSDAGFGSFSKKSSHARS
jgi:hypothetical protein